MCLHPSVLKQASIQEDPTRCEADKTVEANNLILYARLMVRAYIARCAFICRSGSAAGGVDGT